MQMAADVSGGRVRKSEWPSKSNWPTDSDVFSISYLVSRAKQKLTKGRTRSRIIRLDRGVVVHSKLR